MVEYFTNTEGIPKLVREFTARFDSLGITNIFSHLSESNTAIRDNSCYIFTYIPANNLRTLNVSSQKRITLPIDLSTFDGAQRDTKSSDNNPQSDFVFYLQSGEYAGTYHVSKNVLYIVYDITHTYNTATKTFFDEIFKALEDTTPGIDESLIDTIKPKDELLLTHKGKIFKLVTVSENTSFMEEYANRVTDNAKRAIAQIKSQYLQQLQLEKQKYQTYRKSHMPMPEIKFENCLKHKVMISKYGERLQYNFIVDFTVTEAIDEIAHKRVLLDKPIIFSNRILQMTFDTYNKLSSVFMCDFNGNGESRHLHMSSGTICVGTTGIIGKKADTLQEVVALKDRLMEALTRYNVVDAVQRNDFRDELRAKLEKAPTSSWTDHVWHVA